MPDTYSKKLVFVIGASEGIGKAVVQEFVKAGAHVVFTSRDLNKLKTAYDEILPLRQNDAQTLIYQAFDVTDAAQTQKMLLQMVETFGVPDFVIHCAGYARPGYIEDLNVNDYVSMMNLNYLGLVHVCHTLAPILQKHKKGHIVNTSSIAGFVGLFGYTGYCASKFAAVGFSEALRRELKPFGITVSVLCPPNTKTPGLARENQTKPIEVLKTEEKIKPVSAEFVAQKLLRALPKKKFWIIPTFDGRLTHWMNRHLPWVVERFVRR